MIAHQIKNAICTHICEREPTNPATYFELVQVAAAHEPSITSAEINQILAAMIEAGEIEQFEDEERGTVYVRDC